MIPKEKCFGIIPLRRSKDGLWEALIALHSSGEYWGFPKGHLREEEQPKEAATRELYEETGLKVLQFLDHIAPLLERYVFLKEGKEVEKEVIYFPALVEGIARAASEEILEVTWEKLSSAHTRISFEASQNIAKDLHIILE